MTARDIEALVGELTLDEKLLMLAGEDLWSTVAVPRLGVPKVKVTDGPSGARGGSLPGMSTVTALGTPSATALGATWNVELVSEVGAAIGQDARTKYCRVLLAPTVNLHRSPLGGRNFECYSEDPLLSGKLAAGFVRGVQGEGLATTVKHFAGNDAETERYTMNSIIDERTLRELYLVPFELAVKEGGALGIMTGYNRLNGTWCSEHRELLANILRREWGFDGFVISDWFSPGDTVDSIRAGMDLEMGGPGRCYAPEAVRAAINGGALTESDIDARLYALLHTFDRVGALDDPIVPPDEESVDREEHRVVARKAAAESMVLLRNESVLPFDRGTITRIAVIGANAQRVQTNGGGSAQINPHYRVTPIDAIRAAVGDRVSVSYSVGCDIEKSLPAISSEDLRAPGGEPGLRLDFFANATFDGDVVLTEARPTSELLFFGSPAGVPDDFSVRATGTLTARESGTHTLGFVQAGRLRVFLDDRIVLDGFANPPGPGSEFFGLASDLASIHMDLVAGETYELIIEFASIQAGMIRGGRVGLRPPRPQDLIGEAVAAARDADAVIVVVGTNAEWESEGHDRTSMHLPLEQDALVAAVCAANPKTAVVLNTGSVVLLDWAKSAGAIVQAWFGGQEMANALVDVLFGDAEPSGRLPTTIPMRLEHNPSFATFPGEHHEHRYGEGLLMGYRWYDTRRLPVRYPFGHGMSYTSFSVGTPRLSSSTFASGDTLHVEVDVTNTGNRSGSHVIQCYVAPLAPGRIRPAQELKAFAKVELDPGQQTTVTLSLDDRAFATWEPAPPNASAITEKALSVQPLARPFPPATPSPGWRVEAGGYEIRIARSSAEVDHRCAVTIAETVLVPA